MPSTQNPIPAGLLEVVTKQILAGIQEHATFLSISRTLFLTSVLDSYYFQVWLGSYPYYSVPP